VLNLTSYETPHYAVFSAFRQLYINFQFSFVYTDKSKGKVVPVLELSTMPLRRIGGVEV